MYQALKDYEPHFKTGEYLEMSMVYAKDLLKKGFLKEVDEEERRQFFLGLKEKND